MDTFTPLTSPRTIIAIAGKGRSGKTTVANYIAQSPTDTEPYRSVAFGDTLKEAAMALNPIIGFNHFGELMRLQDAVDMYGPEDVKDKIPEVRQFLQRVGTEGGWQVHGRALWVNHVIDKINGFPDNVPVLVTDLRFPTEIEWARSVGAPIIEVVRPGKVMSGEAGEHVSESVTVDDPDYRIVNDAGLAELYQKVDDIILNIHGRVVTA